METEEIREKKEPKRLPVWACILLFALGLFVCMGLYGTIGFGLLSLILGDEARHPGLLVYTVTEANMLGADTERACPGTVVWTAGGDVALPDRLRAFAGYR